MEQPAPTTGMNALMTNAVAVHVLIRPSLTVHPVRAEQEHVLLLAVLFMALEVVACIAVTVIGHGAQ